MMDNFARMLRSAPEIQEAWVPKDGDVTDKGVFVGYCVPFGPATSPKEFLKVKKFPEHKFEGCGTSHFKKDILWIPTSDDLLGMVEGKPEISESIKDSHLTTLLFNLYKFSLKEKYDYIKDLLLAFVMHEKFGKRWTGEGWR
jgi:hypothetical protein